jgi:ureidoacrylate peracid hydrolase
VKRTFGHDVYETLEEVLDPAHSCVVSIDVQNDFCVPGGHYDRHGKDLSMMAEMLPRLRRFLAGARELGVPVVHLQQTTLPDGKSDSPAWLYLKTRDGKSPDYTLDGTWGWEFVEGCGPVAGEVVVRKHRSSGFVHTNLETILRGHGAKTVVMAGTTTQGCVESTAREASHNDFYAVVVGDCVATTSRKLHEASLLVQSVRHEIIPSDRILGIWSAARPRPTTIAR